MGTQMNLLGNIPKEYGFSEITDKQTRRAENDDRFLPGINQPRSTRSSMLDLECTTSLFIGIVEEAVDGDVVSRKACAIVVVPWFDICSGSKVEEMKLAIKAR